MALTLIVAPPRPHRRALNESHKRYNAKESVLR